MFRSSTIIRELALNLAKVIFTLKHSVKLSLFIMWLCGGMSWNGVCVVFCAECESVAFCTATQFMRLCGSMLPHNRIINNDVISSNILT